MEGRLLGTDIHGFHTLQDLDVQAIMEEARSRWLRPNEIHAILCNYKCFTIHVKPVNLPKSGTIVLFDRKMLRNFRKDGHNWKKKKDGKTVKEAHEHLKVGDEERIHVYYAHGQDNLTFVRRCYWLLDKSLEHIVLVHYRETQEGSPVTPVNSNSSSASDPSAPWPLSEELDSGTNHAYFAGENETLVSSDNLTVRNHEQRLHDINTLEWDELLVTNDSNNSVASRVTDKVSFFNQQNQVSGYGLLHGGANSVSPEISSFNVLTNPTATTDDIGYNLPHSACVPTVGAQLNSNVQRRDSIGVGAGGSLDVLVNDGLHSLDSFGRWINDFITDSSDSVDGSVLETSEQIFNITNVSPAWAYSNEKTKILLTGLFREEYQHLANSNLLCVCGDVIVTAEIVQLGVYRCLVSPHSPGSVNLYISLEGFKPISQVLNFEYRTPVLSDQIVSSEERDRWEEFQMQMRLAYLLFSTSKSLEILTSKASPNALKEAKKYAQKTSHVSNSLASFVKSIEDGKIPFSQAKDSLFKLILRNRLKDWLLERVVYGSKISEFDAQGQGVIHLCAILGYTWAISLFSASGLSLDFRDKHGWTALHWAAYFGREKMVAVLLSAGAKPNLVTDPTPDNPGGHTAADLASLNGYDGLAGYLSEKALVEQFKDMSIAGNASGTLDTSTNDLVSSENLCEEELNLKETLAAYRTAADAAARIHVAFRERSLKIKTKAIENSNPEVEARNIVAAMKIQHAFRNYETRKKMAAAARIQHRFRTWKIRKEFLNLRRQAIKIQAAFRGYQMRRQYRKILWSVGVVEKAILRWRLKRRGFRGLQVGPIEAIDDQSQGSDTEEDFYKASKKQAEERVERAVVRVQTMFRSKKAQEEYRRMKMTHNQAMLQNGGFLDPDNDLIG